MRAVPAIRTAGAVLAVAAAAWVSFDLLRDAYGAGAPYYGRTANMDKWASPWPTLIVVDGVALGLAWLLLRRRRL